MKRALLTFVLPLLLVTGAVGGAVVLVRSAESAERDPPKLEPPLVEVAEVAPALAGATITGTGVVEPARRISISSEVDGRLVFVADKLVTGGRLKRGELLMRIDDRDYRLTIRERRNQVQQAKLESELEAGRAEIAQREWKMLQGTDAAAPSRLVLREPYREANEVSLQAAEAALERAQLEHERTRIVTPFNATVLDESVEKGQVVAPGGVLADLIGTDAFWVEVSLPLEDLARIDVPGLGANEGASARVTQRLGRNQEVVRQGTVVRLLGELDRDTRTAKVLVEVADPLDPPTGQLPLLPGAFVSVDISGRELPDALAVPRLAVVEGRSTWVVDGEGTLRARQLEIAWSDSNFVYVTSGVQAGERLLVTTLSIATEGMKVRIQDPKLAAGTKTSEGG